MVSGCSGTSAGLCRPPIGTPDPPPNNTGILTGLLSEESTLTVEPSTSMFNITITQNTDGGPVITSQSTAIHGDLMAHGVPQADGSANVLIDMATTMEDMHFTANGTKVDITYIIATGGAGTSPVHIDSFGDGTITMGNFALTLDFTQNGQRSRLETTNSKDVSIHIDYPSQTFQIASIPFDSLQGLTGDFSLHGTITNQGPVARTTADQVLECTSPAGATATLDGSSSSDADNDIQFASWSRGAEFGNIITTDPVSFKTTAVSPLGITTYGFQVMDSKFQTSFTTTDVKVQDTTPPMLTLGAPQPACLWAPNHKVVLYELGKQLPYAVHDTCDPNPKVQILSVTSNQPDVGGGQGDFGPDFTSGKSGLCLRSERQATVMWDRQYTITFLATDSSNNKTIQSVVVSVPHDQAGATKCPNIDPSRYVDITDPRCTEN